MNEYLTTQEAADLLGYTRRHINKLFIAGHITGIRFGVKVILLDRDSVLSYEPQVGRIPETRFKPPIDKANRSKP